MNVARTSAAVSVVSMLLVASSAVHSTACRSCIDVGLKESECAMQFGKFDEEECRCVGARPYEPPQYPAPGTCKDDNDCGGGRCRDGRCRSADCATDLDCRAEAECTRSSPTAPGVCRRSCSIDADCGTLACVGGLCSAPRTRVGCGEDDVCPTDRVCRAASRECVPRCLDGDGAECGPEGCRGAEECFMLDYGWCEADADCRASEGALCTRGRCRGGDVPTPNDAGPDGS